MSTYYYLGCDAHKERVPFWGRWAGGPFVINTARTNPETVQNFLDEHLKCGVSAFSEHDQRAYDYRCALEEEDDIDVRAV